MEKVNNISNDNQNKVFTTTTTNFNHKCSNTERTHSFKNQMILNIS